MFLVCNILQSLQLIFNVAIIVLGNGQGLSQIAKFKICFSVCLIIWTVAGMLIGQVKTLQVPFYPLLSSRFNANDHRPKRNSVG